MLGKLPWDGKRVIIGNPSVSDNFFKREFNVAISRSYTDSLIIRRDELFVELTRRGYLSTRRLDTNMAVLIAASIIANEDGQKYSVERSISARHTAMTRDQNLELKTSIEMLDKLLTEVKKLDKD